MSKVWPAFFSLVQSAAAQVGGGSGAAAGGAVATDWVSLVVVGVFVGGFVALAVAYLVKKRRERIETLTQASLEAHQAHDLQDYVDGKRAPALQDGDEDAVPKAKDLMGAEREAKNTAAAKERAARERERAQEQAQQADAQEREAALERLDAAKDAEAQAQAAAEEARKRAKQLRMALSKTRDGFVGRLSKVLGKGEIDASLLDDLEGVLFTADIGARTADRLLSVVRDRLKANELADASKVTELLKDEITKILNSVHKGPLIVRENRPQIFMIIGVNGSGKTTSIGKLTYQMKSDGNKVLLGAGDTFRAAAVEQLAVWAERNDCKIVRGEPEADPASVLFDAVKTGVDEGFDVVLCDTAGRLHTKVNLMEELKKVQRVIGKACDGAPHEVILVLDSTVGQNAIQQARQFGEVVPITGIILTKLDGTAKGGVVIGIAAELGIPVRYIGVGEQLDDLRPFDPETFVSALFDEEDLRKVA